jgi:hypothetical protein
MRIVVVLAIAACAGPTEVELAHDPASCAGCHAGAYASWRASRHAASFVDGAFHAELEPRREAWCIGCHAPLAGDPATVRNDDPLARAGVACLACHGRGGELVSASRAPDSPHATRRDPTFGSPTWCASCHQFNFPVLDDRGRVVRMTAHPMQDTVAQSAGEDCRDCHDVHRAAGSHDAEMRDRALAITTCTRDGELRIELANVGAGHNVPAGGVDRHIVLRVWRSSAPDKLVETVLGRTFAAAPDGGKRAVSDTTLPPGATRTIGLETRALGGEPGEPITVELTYVFAADEHAQIADTELAATMSRVRASQFPACGRDARITSR